jgi:hypothetical protein
MGFDQAIRRRGGKIVKRAVGDSFDRAQIERMGTAATIELEEIGAQRVKRQIEGAPEIAREMRARDLQAMRLEIIDKALADAKFFPQLLLGAGGGTFSDFVLVIR